MSQGRGGVVRVELSVPHVVGHGHMVTSEWVPLGPIKARWAPMGRIVPYLSRTPIWVSRVIRQGPMGHNIGP